MISCIFQANHVDDRYRFFNKIKICLKEYRSIQFICDILRELNIEKSAK